MIASDLPEKRGVGTVGPHHPTKFQLSTPNGLYVIRGQSRNVKNVRKFLGRSALIFKSAEIPKYTFCRGRRAMSFWLITFRHFPYMTSQRPSKVEKLHLCNMFRPPYLRHL